MSKGILVTGVPGFIGNRLVADLLPQQRPIYLLSEHRFQEKAETLARRLDPTG